ncbi:MAG: phosphate ABC transporter permease PstA [Porphyromonas sp.]|nr:phosphate ABC transporter permease PstA [Porphyromonas sp.]
MSSTDITSQVQQDKIAEVASRPTRLKSKIAADRFIYVLVIILTISTAIPLFSILFELIVKGYKQFNLGLFTQVVPTSMEAMYARESGEIIPGGILNGITGTLMMLAIAIAMAVPLGIFAGIFLAEKKESWLAKVVRVLTDILQGIPSIVYGIVVYMWIVSTMHSFSALAGGVSLGFMMLPMIIRSTEESIAMIPTTLKEAGLGLGASYTSVMFRVIVPSAFGGLFTGILLAISRVMGETAPLMVTALGANYISYNITKPMSAVSLLIWEFYNDPNLADLIWSSSLLLLILIFGMNLLAKAVANKWRIN